MEKKKIQIPNGKTIKLSKFKQEQQEIQQLEQREQKIENKFKSKVFKNDIKEINNNNSNIVKDIIKLEPSGFPKPKLNLNLGSKSTNIIKIKEKSNEIKNEKELNKIKNNSQNEITNFDENLEKVLSMTPEEVENSLSQLSLMFSAENLQFLKLRGDPKEITNSQTNQSNNSNYEQSSSSKPNRINEVNKLNLKSTKQFESKDYIAKTSEELKEQIQIAPKHIKKALQWTLDTNETFEEEKLDKQNSNEKLISTPRYDLQGARIVNTGINFLTNEIINQKNQKEEEEEEKKTMFQEWFMILKNSFLSRILTLDEIQEIIILSISKLINSEFIFEVKVDQQGELEFIPELDHHEFCRGMPGYNLLETCEVIYIIYKN